MLGGWIYSLDIHLNIYHMVNIYPTWSTIYHAYHFNYLIYQIFQIYLILPLFGLYIGEVYIQLRENNCVEESKTGYMQKKNDIT
jgi:hypothetical protein